MDIKLSMRRISGPVLSLLLFGTASWLLRDALAAHHLRDILNAMRTIPAARIWIAAALTLASYLTMSVYDVLALRHIERPLPYRQCGPAAFTGYAFSNNIGLSMLAGASVRYRLYSAWGLSAIEITQVVAFCTLSLWLGFCALGGVVFVSQPPPVPATFHLPAVPMRVVGLVLLTLVAGYGVLVIRRREPIRFHGNAFVLPGPGLAAFQVVVAMIDWSLAGAVLFVLIRPAAGLGFGTFLGAFLLAQLLALISQVPGGLGVFETVVVLMLSGHLPAGDIFGALLTYRLLYYWLPLMAAALFLGVQEIAGRAGPIRRVALVIGKWASPVLPQILAYAAFIAGAILLFSGATPGLDARLAYLRNLLPLPLLEMSHFIGSLAGMGLILIGRGLQRRLDAAWMLALILLGVGAIASLAKGLDYEEALVQALVALALLPARRHFYRKASLWRQRYDTGWIVAILVVLGASVWLGLYAHRHVPYSDRLWWQFTLNGNASRFLRATLGVGIIGLFVALRHLMQPRPPRPAQPGAADVQTAAEIVAQSQRTSAHLALLGDKHFLFNMHQSAFIMYGIEGRSWISMGDPVGPAGEWPDLIWQFRELSDTYGGWCVFYEVGHESLHLYLDLGLSMVKLGEEARVPLAEFSMDGKARRNFRNTLRRIEKNGCRFELLAPGQVDARLDEIQQVSDAWLADKHTREKGFSLGFFDREYIRRHPVAVVFGEDGILAFANLWPGAQNRELSVDLMRFRPGAPNGIMDFLFIRILLWAKDQGYQWFNLGMAPLSGLQSRPLAPLWNRLGAFVFRHGEHFYNFQGLRQYKEKFSPLWQPKYLVMPGGLAGAQVFINLAALVSGSLKGALRK